MKRFYYLLLVSFLILAVLISLQPLKAEADKQVEPASEGVLDLNQPDVPLSYIDRQPYTLDSPEKQQENFRVMDQYVKEQQAQQELRKQRAAQELEKAIQTFTALKQKYDQSRKSYNYNNYTPYDPYGPYYEGQSQFSTEVRRQQYRPCPYPDPNCYTPYPPDPYSHYGYQPYVNIFNIPGYIGNRENHYNGRDDDGDNFVDEGFTHGNVQIILGDSGATKDDEWALYIDGRYMGANNRGNVRTWDLNLYPGTHNITIVGANIPDNSGTYSIVFRNANVVSGPPLAGESMRQGQSLQWLIQVR